MKRIFLCTTVIAVLFLLLAFLSIPRVDTIEYADVSSLEAYPELHNSYRKLCNDHSLYEIVTEDRFYIVTVKNIWGSWERYILPCFAAETRDVPTAGNATFTAFMYVLSPWSEENIFTRVCSLTLGLNVYMIPGENTFVSEKFKVVPDNGLKDDNMIVFDGGINCNKQAESFVYYTVATSSSADKRDQETSATFQWKYFLKFNRRELRFGDVSVERTYIVND